MAEVEILHRLFSHAARDEWAESGWRNVPLDERDARRDVPAEVLHELDGLMAKIVPAGDDTAWVVRRFAAANGTYACVIACHPGLVADRGGRIGLVSHARLVHVPAGQAWLDAAALVEIAESFAIADVRAMRPELRLQGYVDLLSEESTASIREVTLSELDLPRAFLSDMLVGALARISRREQIRVALPPPEQTLIADLARAWAAIPVALQLTSAWATGLADGCPVDVVFAVSSGKPPRDVGSPALVDFVSRYVSVLLDSPHDFSAVLRNPEITSVSKLNDALQRAEPLSRIGDFTPPPAESVDMKKDRKKAPQSPIPHAEIDGDIHTELDRQFRAMETSLRTYIDQRFAAMEARATQREPKAAPTWTWQRGLALAGIIAMTVLVTWALTRKPLREPRRDDETTTIAETMPAETIDDAETPTTDPRMEARKAALDKVIATAENDRKWGEGLKTLIAENGAMVSDAIAEATKGLPENHTVRVELSAIAKLIDDGKLQSRDRVRDLLIDVLSGRRIDGRLDDVDVDEIKSRYGVKSESKDIVKGFDLQSEIILRWLKEKYP